MERGDGIRFTHALIREALYESIPALRRRRIHREVGAILAALPSPDPDAVAYHFEQAGDERAALWLVRAGERAEDAYALVTATERYERAVAILDVQGGDPGERGWLRLLLALLRRYEEPGRAFMWVAEAARLAADAEDARLAAWAKAMQGLLVGHRGDHRAAIALLGAALDEIARLPPGTGTTGRREQRIETLVNRGTLVNNLAHFGHLREARAQAEGYLARLAAPRPTAAEAGVLANIHSALAVVYVLQGEPVRATRIRRMHRDVRGRRRACVDTFDPTRGIGACRPPLSRRRSGGARGAATD